MPYEVKPSNPPPGYDVVNTATGDVKAHHDTEQQAREQVALLHQIEQQSEAS